MNQYPGDLLDNVARGATGAVRNLVSSVAGGLRGAGESVQSALDQPAQAVGVSDSPARILDDPLKGLVGAWENGINQGIIRSIEMVGDGITSGLDRIPKTLTNIGGNREGGLFARFRR
jgi:hypothetical protein